MPKYNYTVNRFTAKSIEAAGYEIDSHDNLHFYRNQKKIASYPNGTWGELEEEADNEADILRNRVLDALGGERFEK